MERSTHSPEDRCHKNSQGQHWLDDKYVSWNPVPEAVLAASAGDDYNLRGPDGRLTRETNTNRAFALGWFVNRLLTAASERNNPDDVRDLSDAAHEVMQTFGDKLLPDPELGAEDFGEVALVETMLGFHEESLSDGATLETVRRGRAPLGVIPQPRRGS